MSQYKAYCSAEGYRHKPLSIRYDVDVANSNIFKGRMLQIFNIEGIMEKEVFSEV